MARQTCYDLVHKLQLYLPFRDVTLLNIYVRDSSARSVFLSFANWTIHRYHSCRTPNICFSLENTGNENIKKSFHTFFQFVPPIGSFTYFRQFENSSDNHHCIGFKSSFSSFFSYFSKAKLWGWIIRCSLFSTLFFKKSVLFDLCQKK